MKNYADHEWFNLERGNDGDHFLSKKIDIIKYIAKVIFKYWTQNRLADANITWMSKWFKWLRVRGTFF